MKFLIYEDASKEWRWKLKAVNGEIIADGSEGYATKSNCIKAVRRIKTRVNKVARATEEIGEDTLTRRVSHRNLIVATVLENL
jgi:uncharacterized protein YegP (UPF0339 family)